MNEREYRFESKITHEDDVPDYYGQEINMIDSQGNIIAQHQIFPIPLEDSVSFLKGIGRDDLASLQYPMYAESIKANQKGLHIGEDLWKYAEEHFFNTHNKPYFRIVLDLSSDLWTARHVPNVLEYLKSKKIPIVTKLEDKSDGRYTGILLFKDIK